MDVPLNVWVGGNGFTAGTGDQRGYESLAARAEATIKIDGSKRLVGNIANSASTCFLPSQTTL
jgi:hypothetical protein